MEMEYLGIVNLWRDSSEDPFYDKVHIERTNKISTDFDVFEKVKNDEFEIILQSE